VKAACSVILANAGLGPGFLLGTAYLLLFIPVVTLEGIAIRTLLGVPLSRSLRLSFIANLLSTIAGLVLVQFPIENGPSLLSLCFVITIIIEDLYLRTAIEGADRGKRLRTVLIMNLLSYGLLVPFLGIPQRNPRVLELSCQNNLRQIGMALRLYAEDAGGHFPPELQTLLTQRYLFTEEAFSCPSAEASRRNGFACDYVYCPPPGPLAEADAAAMPVVWDFADNHRISGNVLYADGTVVTYRHEEWQELVRRLAREPEQSRLSP